MVEHISEQELVDRYPAVRRVELPIEEIVGPEDWDAIHALRYVWEGNALGRIRVEGDTAIVELRGPNNLLNDHYLGFEEARFGFPVTQRYEGLESKYEIHTDRPGVATYFYNPAKPPPDLEQLSFGLE